MPQVTKQTTKAARPSKNGSVLDRIQDVSAMEHQGLRVNIYGRGKTGKTRFACTFPKPVLIIGTEDGTKSVKGMKGVKYVQIYNTEEITQLLPLFMQGQFKTAVIDHASGLQDIVLKEVLGLADVPVQKSWGIAKQQDWGTCALQTKEHLLKVLQLSESHGTNVVIIAHERNFNDEVKDSEVIFPTVGSALTPSVAGWLNGMVDYICQTYIREEIVRAPAGQGSNVIMEQKSGKKEFCLRVGPHPVFMTGFRLAPGIELPDSIVNPTYDKIIKLINGKSVK